MGSRALWGMRKIVAMLLLAGLMLGGYWLAVQKGWNLDTERIAGQLEDRH